MQLIRNESFRKNCVDRFDFEGRHGVQGRADSRLFSDLTAWFSPAPKILVSIMPPLCPLTNEIVSAPGLLAASAWSKLKFIEEPFCARCGAPFSYEVGAGAECARCIAEPPDFDSARAAIVYDDASHGLIVSFKHADRTDLTPLLAQWLMQAGAGVLRGAASFWRRRRCIAPVFLRAGTIRRRCLQ